MFRQLRVHTPAPLTPDGQRVADQAGETFALSLTPAEGRGGQTSSRLESGVSRTRSFIRFSELESLSLDVIRWLVT
jgi:hypothetical protein